jgi:hypothetical protein
MKNWYSGVYKALIIASAIAFLIHVFTTGQTSLGAIISAYSVLVIAVMMIIIIVFNGIFKSGGEGSTTKLLMSLFLSSGPFLLMFAIIGFLLYLMIVNKDRIVNGEVSSNYNMFSNLIVMLLMIQLYMIYTSVSSKQFEDTGSISKMTSAIVYLIGLITGICTFIVYIILTYYIADGFINK